jgi:subtilisin family serine protease
MAVLRSGARVATALTLGVLLLAAGMGGPAGALTPSSPPNLIVGFTGRYVDTTLLANLSGVVTGTSETLGLAAVYAADPAVFAAAAILSPKVAWVETNDAVRSFSAGWDSTGWNSTGWDSASWDGAGWDGAGWDGAGWDGAGWDGAGWDGRGWNRSTMTGIGRTQGPTGTDPLFSWQWGLVGVNLTRVATTYGGSKTVCVVDSGVDATHPELASRIAPGGHDFANKDGDPSDDAGHGTHVAGIIAAQTGNGLGIAGVSSSKILPVKVLASDGVGQEYDLALGIDHCRAKGANVVSMSLGTPEKSKAVHRAVVDAFAQGIVLVASAGNMGPNCDCVQYPAAYPQVISVGAVTPGGTPAAFSSTSQGVDFGAPGYAIVSTLPGNGYGAANGTSMAAPFVSAAAAILLDRGMDAPNATRTMMETALDLGPEGRDQYFGFGVIDIGAAVART